MKNLKLSTLLLLSIFSLNSYAAEPYPVDGRIEIAGSWTAASNKQLTTGSSAELILDYGVTKGGTAEAPTLKFNKPFFQNNITADSTDITARTRADIGPVLLDADLNKDGVTITCALTVDVTYEEPNDGDGTTTVNAIGDHETDLTANPSKIQEPQEIAISSTHDTHGGDPVATEVKVNLKSDIADDSHLRVRVFDDGNTGENRPVNFSGDNTGFTNPFWIDSNVTVNFQSMSSIPCGNILTLNEAGEDASGQYITFTSTDETKIVDGVSYDDDGDPDNAPAVLLPEWDLTGAQKVTFNGNFVFKKGTKVKL